MVCSGGGGLNRVVVAVVDSTSRLVLAVVDSILWVMVAVVDSTSWVVVDATSLLKFLFRFAFFLSHSSFLQLLGGVGGGRGV